MTVNYYWELYEKEINQIIGRTIKQKNIKDTTDIISDAYIWLTEALNKYNPSYNIPFKNYALNYLHLRFVQYNKIQLMRNSGMIKGKYAEINPFSTMTEDKDYVPDIISKEEENIFELKDLIKEFPQPLDKIIFLILNGYTQEEISNKLNVSQSTISYSIKKIRNAKDNPQHPLHHQSNKLYDYIKEIIK